MSNQNNDNNPPQPSAHNIQVKPNTEGHAETVNAAGIVYGGVGNTYNNEVHGQGDKERVENDLRELRSELRVNERKTTERKDNVQKLELEINKLKGEVEKFQQQKHGKHGDIQSIEKKKCELTKEVQHHKDEIARLENDIQGLKEKILRAEIRLGVLKLTVEDTSNAIPTLETQVRVLMHDLEKYVTDVKAEKESIAELHRLIRKIEVEQAKQIEDDRREKEELQRKMKSIEEEQAKQKRQFEDDRRERDELQRRVQTLRKVIEEKDKDTEQLKDATATAEGKAQEPRAAVQEKITQNKSGNKQVTQKVYRRNVDDLFIACNEGNLAEVKRVLDLGLDANCIDGWDRTPVMWAAWRGHKDVVEFLVSRGADVLLGDKSGNYPLHLASMAGHLGTVEFILSTQNVADLKPKNNSGKTAVDLARANGHHQLADLLVSHFEQDTEMWWSF
ncbi:ankyrin repeat domain-containing protein 2-like [Haliotis asinina]|uniref:ankyrin repeat domain-containing protein 2-like n=1 Tax=Haliotis asinina TaxID=109174 RepID=UPI003531B43E